MTLLGLLGILSATLSLQAANTPAKNNDGELGPRSAWLRRAGWFDPVPDFNFEDFDGGGGPQREARVKEDYL